MYCDRPLDLIGWTYSELKKEKANAQSCVSAHDLSQSLNLSVDQQPGKDPLLITVFDKLKGAPKTLQESWDFVLGKTSSSWSTGRTLWRSAASKQPALGPEVSWYFKEEQNRKLCYSQKYDGVRIRFYKKANSDTFWYTYKPRSSASESTLFLTEAPGHVVTDLTEVWDPKQKEEEDIIRKTVNKAIKYLNTTAKASVPTNACMFDAEMVFTGPHVSDGTQNYPGTSKTASFFIFDVFWWGEECEVRSTQTIQKRLLKCKALTTAEGSPFESITLLEIEVTPDTASETINKTALDVLQENREWEGLVFRGSTDMFAMKVKLKTPVALNADVEFYSYKKEELYTSLEANKLYVRVMNTFDSLPKKGDVVWRYGYQNNPLMIGPLTQAVEGKTYPPAQLSRITKATLQHLSMKLEEAISVLRNTP
jgi:hypothetical protein